jgi:hypothetical protein
VSAYTTSAHLTADEILFVAAGCRTVRLPSIHLIVVTGTHAPNDDEPRDWPFTPGELLVVNIGADGDSFPELLGDRDIGQWDTRAVRYFTTDVRQATALAELVRGGAERGMWEWDGNRWYRASDQTASIDALNSAGSDPDAAFIGDTDGDNRWGLDIRYPGQYHWPTRGKEA